MTLKCIGSSSAGNCYILTCDNEILILDCGLPIKQIKQSLNFNLQGIKGIIVTHGHKDHSLSVKDFKRMGFDVWQPYLDENKLQRKCFGGFTVRSFDVPHDDEPCAGYLIECPNGERLLYATDLEYCKYSFKKMNVNHILIECNYQQELVNRDLPNYEHKIRGHCSLNTCKEFIKANATDSLQTVVLCHLGGETAEPEECISEVKKIAPKANVYVAEGGLDIELRDRNKCPF